METVTVSLIDGMRFEGRTARGGATYAVQMDADAEFGGQDKGSGPFSLMLVSLGGCAAMDVISILRKKQQLVTGLEARISAEQADAHPKVYTRIGVEFVVTGRGVDPAAVERAIDLSMNKYCPAAAMLKQVVPIETSYRIVEG